MSEAVRWTLRTLLRSTEAMVAAWLETVRCSSAFWARIEALLLLDEVSSSCRSRSCICIATMASVGSW